jgi:hypothetical protein
MRNIVSDAARKLRTGGDQNVKWARSFSCKPPNFNRPILSPQPSALYSAKDIVPRKSAYFFVSVSSFNLKYFH